MPPHGRSDSRPQRRTPPRIVVHAGLDLDAAISAAYLGARPEDLYFLPPRAKALPPGLQDAVILDHPMAAESRGDRDESGRVGSSFLALIQQRDKRLANTRLVRDVDAHDRSGMIPHPGITLGDMFNSMKAAVADAHPDLRGESFDRKVYETSLPLLKGLLIRAHHELEAILDAERIPTVKVGRYTFAVMDERFGDPTVINDMIRRALVDMGICGTIFFHPSRGTFGVSRFPGCEDPDLRVLGPHLPGWFIHKDGFLAAWGTAKMPQMQRPPYGTPQGVSDLTALLQAVLRDGPGT